MVTFKPPRGKEWLHLLGQFVIGGVMVAGISAASVLLNTKDAALLYALPVTYVPVLAYVWRGNSNTTNTTCGMKTLVTYVGQNVAGFTLLTLFCMSLYFIISAHSKTTPTNKDENNTLTRTDIGWMSAVALVLFAVCGILYWMWVCNVDNCTTVPPYCVLGIS